MSIDVANLKLPDAISQDKWGEPSKHNNYYDPATAAKRYNQEKERAQYAADKLLGRRRENGQPNLKKLTAKHKQIIAQYVVGTSPAEIASMFDIAVMTVHRIVSDPLAKEYLDEFEEMHKREFNAMLPLVNNAVRSALTNPGIQTKLKGADRWGKLHRVLNGENKGEEGRSRSQELHAARFRFIEKVKEIALQSGAIEAEAVIVETSDADSG